MSRLRRQRRLDVIVANRRTCVTHVNDARRRTHLERMLAELDLRLVRLTDTTSGPFDEAAIARIANLETAQSAVVRLLASLN